MLHVLRQSRALLAVYYADMMQYRAELVLWVLGTLLPFILLGVWAEVSRAGGTPGMVPDDHARYFFATFIVSNMTLVWVVWAFERDVVQGILSHRLLQPMDPGWRYFWEHIAERIVRLPLVLGLSVFFFVLYPGAMWRPGVDDILLAIVAIVLTFLMRYAVQYAFAQLAFWTERAHAVEQLWALPYMFFSGRVAPLELYPDTMRQILFWTPFPYLIWFPSRIITGDTGEVSIAFGLSITIGWAIVFFFIYRGLWKLGLRKYSGMGA